MIASTGPAQRPTPGRTPPAGAPKADESPSEHTDPELDGTPASVTGAEPTATAGAENRANGLDATLLRATARLAAPTAFLTAWLYYIGWVKTNRQASYFGVDPSLLDYSTADYVLRSVTSLLGPAGAVLIGLLVVGAARRRIDRIDPASAAHTRLRPIGRWTVGVGSVLVVIGGLYLNRLGAGGFASALAAIALVLGGLLLLGGRYLGLRADRVTDPAARIDAVEVLLVGLVLAVGLFAAGFFYAVQVGEFTARALEGRLPTAPEVHLLSTSDLGLGGATSCQPLRSSDSAYRCRYTGLRLLTATGGNLFLVPENWGRAGAGYVHVVPLGDDVRVDLRTR